MDMMPFCDDNGYSKIINVNKLQFRKLIDHIKYVDDIMSFTFVLNEESDIDTFGKMLNIHEFEKISNNAD